MVQSYKIPWAVWREPEFKNFTFPDSWDISIFNMNGSGTHELPETEIKSSILNPIGTPRISELATGKKNIVIVTDDMTRPTEISRIIPHVLDELKTAKINEDQITILLAIGAHKPMNRGDCILKFGKDIVNKFQIENHHPYENLKYYGESTKGTPIYVNKTYADADLKIAIGGVIPHPLAGFGGGAKIVLPGVCGIDTLEANHRGSGGGIGRITEARRDIEEIAGKVGLDFSINVIFSETGKIAKVFSGHFENAHREAMGFGKQFYSTKITVGNKICFFNSFPEDSELNQTQWKAFNFMMTSPESLIDDLGAIVITSSSYEGRGYHSLVSETGSRLYKNIGETRFWDHFIRKRKVYLFSPNVNNSDKDHFFPKSVILINKWEDLIQELKKYFTDSPKVAIIPTSIQLAETSKE
ncbi:MAG: lactate racemase domain-containing protein [Promethearchaeota archaeon]|jgi:nickel-dependent lactate racemase